MRKKYEYGASKVRDMMVVSYFERGLYEMEEEQLTTENILALARKVEKFMAMTKCKAFWNILKDFLLVVVDCEILNFLSQFLQCFLDQTLSYPRLIDN